MTTKKEPAIALKDIMAALDKKDRDFYSRLTDELSTVFYYYELSLFVYD